MSEPATIDLRNPPLNAMLKPEEAAIWLQYKHTRALLRDSKVPKHGHGRLTRYHVATVLEAIGPKRKAK
jgi:hypothetical protein